MLTSLVHSLDSIKVKHQIIAKNQLY